MLSCLMGASCCSWLLGSLVLVLPFPLPAMDTPASLPQRLCSQGVSDSVDAFDRKTNPSTVCHVEFEEMEVVGSSRFGLIRDSIKDGVVDFKTPRNGVSN